MKCCRFVLFAFLLPLLGLLVAGCAPGKPKAIPVKGSIRYQKSKIPAGALVVFHPTDPAREKELGGKPHGKVADDGTFTLTTYAAGDGAPEGEYGVTVEWRPKVAAKMALSEEGGSAAPNMLQHKYSDPKKPFKTVTIKAGGDNDIQLDVD